MANRSQVSGTNVGTGQQKATGQVPAKITPTKDIPKPLPSEAEALEREHYRAMGKVPPPIEDETLEVDAAAGEQLRERLKELQAEADPVVAAAMKENHRSGPNYVELKAMYEEEKAKAEAAGELLNQARIIINNPFHRYGQFVDSIPLGRALGMEKVWQPKVG